MGEREASDFDAKAWMGGQIRRTRKRAGLSQAGLAARIHTDQGSVSRWELGKVLPEMAALIAIARACGVGMDVFTPAGAKERERSDKLTVAAYMERHAKQLRREATSNGAGVPPGREGEGNRPGEGKGP